MSEYVFCGHIEKNPVVVPRVSERARVCVCEFYFSHSFSSKESMNYDTFKMNNPPITDGRGGENVKNMKNGTGHGHRDPQRGDRMSNDIVQLTA